MNTSLYDALSLDGRRVLITGGSLGIGRAIAQLFARRGADIVIHHASSVDTAMGYPDAAAQLHDELRSKGACVARIDVDLAQPGSGGRVVGDAMAALGDIDIFVHAASVQVREAFDNIGAETLGKQVRIDFDATVELLQSIIPVMVRQRFGRIVAIGSVNQVRPHPELSIYAALKAAQHNLVIGIAKQHAASGITANTISPGLIRTPRNDFRRKDMDEWARIEKSANPMGRAGTPEEVAEVAALLAAPAGAFITGADIAMDGGGRL